jgi:SAM-dependent methyltransferase/GNAT superfamily N-acetyltransferase
MGCVEATPGAPGGRMSDASIERLDVTDRDIAEQLLAIQHAAYRIEADLIGFDGIPPLHETLDELMSRPLQWLGIREGGRVVAAIALTGEDRRCDIDRLIVDPLHHRRGLGRRLVETVMRHEVVTVSTGTKNLPAMALYEALGFQPVNVRDIGPGVTVTEHARRNTHLATSFDADVSNYERARPAYPAELWSRLVDVCGIGPGTRLLEIGPGTGMATVPLLDLGAQIVAIEPGPNMAARLRERVEGRACEILESTFEDAHVVGPFDVVGAGTAFHWVDPQVGIPKAASLLVDGGWLALWWTVHGHPDVRDDEWDEAYRRITEGFQTNERRESKLYAFDRDARVAEITAGGLFRLVDHVVIPWQHTHDGASLRALFASFSDWSTLPEPDRTVALDAVAAFVDERPGGTVTRTYATVLFLAEKVSGPRVA